METTLFIAQILGLYYAAAGVGMLVNQKHYAKLFGEARGSAHFIFLAGLLALGVGFVIVTTHNVWDSFWTGLVSAIGWIALVKGLLLLVLPTVGIALASKFMKMKGVMVWEGSLVLALGLVLGWYGFLS